MKKKTGAIYLLYFLCAAIVLASGCDKLGSGKPEKVNGTVISLDEAKKEIVMKDSSSGKQRTITVQNADQMAALKPGMGIKVKIKHGATMADRVTPTSLKDTGKKGKQKAGEDKE